MNEFKTAAPKATPPALPLINKNGTLNSLSHNLRFEALQLTTPTQQAIMALGLIVKARINSKSLSRPVGEVAIANTKFLYLMRDNKLTHTSSCMQLLVQRKRRASLATLLEFITLHTLTRIADNSGDSIQIKALVSDTIVLSSLKVFDKWFKKPSEYTQYLNTSKPKQ
ncbi:MAG: hypothetical protein AAI902_00340 [Candidatus Hodgkinia cicadicola]